MTHRSGAEARRSLHADWQPPRPAGKPPSGSSDFGRAQSLLTQQPPEKSERDLERRRALLDAAEREAKFQAELWARFRYFLGSLMPLMCWPSCFEALNTAQVDIKSGSSAFPCFSLGHITAESATIQEGLGRDMLGRDGHHHARRICFDSRLSQEELE